MKRIISIVLLFLMGTSIALVANAYNKYDDVNMTIVFMEDSEFNEKEKDLIRAKLFGIATGIGDCPDNIICDLFGHSYTEETITTITHKVNATQPRCKQEVLKVKVCSRCSDTQIERMSFEFINCCE